MELHREISFLSAKSKEDPTNSSRSLINKYRSMPGITSEQMLEGHFPLSPRQRLPRFSNYFIRPDYCNLCLNDHPTSSAWIRYNERRVEDLQKRIDLMLNIDDYEEAKFLLRPTDRIPQRQPRIPQRDYPIGNSFILFFP